MQRIRHLLNRTVEYNNDPQRDRVWLPVRNSGTTVTHDTALTYSAVFRAVNYIASQLAMMPWRVMTETNGRKEIVTTHDVDRLLHLRPNPEMTPFSFREAMVSHALTWGNGYAEIERDMANRPMALWPISPDRVEVKRENGVIVYQISNTSGASDILAQENVYHLHGLGYDGLVGYSVVNLARRGIGLGLGAEQTGSSLFENGLLTNLVIEHPEKFGEQAYKNFKDSLLGWMRGAKRAGNPLIVEEGIKTKNLTMPMDDAQFLETRQFQVEEIARWFGLPPHKLQSLDKATFSNIEQQSIEVVVDALQPWAVRLEQEANYKLFSRGMFYTKINMNSLLRGDMKARAEFYREMWNLGVFSVNEIRELEDMNPVPFGEKRFVQMNMTTLENAGEEPEPPLEPEPDEDEQDEDLQMRAIIACSTMLKRERHRVIDAAHRYSESREEFVTWMDAYFKRHFGKMAQAARIADVSDIDAAEFVKESIKQSRLLMLEHYDSGVEYEIEERTKFMTSKLIEVVRRKAS